MSTSTFSNLSCFPTNKNSTNDSHVSSFIPAKTEEKRRQTSRQIWGSGDTKSTKTYFLRNPNLLCFPARKNQKTQQMSRPADSRFGLWGHSNRVSQKIKSVVCQSACLSCFLVFWTADLTFAGFSFFLFFCPGIHLSVCLSVVFFLAGSREGAKNIFCPQGR